MATPPDDTSPDPSSRKSGKPMPPFVAPRTGEHPAATPSTRRSTPLFVPPTALPPEEPAAETPAAKPKPAAMPEFMTPPEAAAAPPPPAPRETLGVENLEVEEISLHITGERPAIGDAEIDVIAYDDANGELDSRAKEGGRPKVDGLELESTELTMEPSAHAPPPPSGLEIESFWAAEAFTPSSKTAEPPRRASGPMPPAFTEPPAPASRAGALDALRVEEMLPPRMPTPQSTRAVTPHSPRASGAAPVSRAMAPAEVRTPRQLEALKELEPWAVPSAASEVSAKDRVAEALERIAGRIRTGDVNVPADANAATDENALSAALQALVRAPRK